jgi:pilus assembly protein Flp/PilA
MTLLMELIRRHLTTERGASLVEYALLLALIAIVCIAAVTAMGGSVGSSFQSSGDSMFGP